MSIFKILREQSAIGFDGRIVFQGNDSGQLKGEVLVHNGDIVGCNYNGSSGKKALLNLAYEDFAELVKFSYIVEPEVIGQEKVQFEFALGDFENTFREVYEKIESSKKLKPPPGKRLIINPDFVCRGDKISASEFDILCTISDFGKVADIYKNSPLLDFEVTLGLVSLRKKGALKVVS
ncbi:MAG: hypothetical protein ACJAT2_003514 [Bacteriovoracaceae bacterium]|jgi:hypothetical protein